MDKLSKQKLFSGGMWVTGGKGFSFLSRLALNAFLARVLAPDDLGAYFLIFSLVNFFMLFAMLGMERSIVRIISRAMALGNFEHASGGVFRVIEIGSVTGVAVAILLYSGIGPFIAKTVFHSELISEAILYPAIWLVIFTLQRIVVESFRGFGDIRFATIFNGLIPNIISASIIGLILLRSGHADITLVLKIIIASYGINLILAAILLFRGISLSSIRNIRHISHTEMLNTSWILYFLNIILYLMISGHLWMLAYYSSKESVAIYGAVSRLIVLITTNLVIISKVILPMIGGLYAQEKFKETEKVLRLTATISAFPSLIALIFIIVFGEKLLFILYGSNYVVGYKTLLILSSAHLLSALTGSPGILMIMASKEKFQVLFAFICTLLGLIISAILVKPLDYFGISVGAALSIVLYNLILTVYCQKILHIKTFISFRELKNLFRKIASRTINFRTTP